MARETSYEVRRLESWGEFLDVITDSRYSDWAFRGHPNEQWPLLSALSRYLMNFRVEMMRNPVVFPPSMAIRHQLWEFTAQMVREGQADGSFRCSTDPVTEGKTIFGDRGFPSVPLLPTNPWLSRQVMGWHRWRDRWASR